MGGKDGVKVMRYWVHCSRGYLNGSKQGQGFTGTFRHPGGMEVAAALQISRSYKLVEPKSLQLSTSSAQPEVITVRPLLPPALAFLFVFFGCKTPRFL